MIRLIVRLIRAIIATPFLIIASSLSALSVYILDTEDRLKVLNLIDEANEKKK
jgi:hypothetical protein